MKAKVKEWLDLARIDLSAAKKLLGDETLTSAASFHAHQSVEKSLKAIIENADKVVPKIHDLGRLHNEIKIISTITIDEDILDDLSKLYIDSRYPAMLGNVPYGRPSNEDAKKYVDYAEMMFDMVLKTFNTSETDLP